MLTHRLHYLALYNATGKTSRTFIMLSNETFDSMVENYACGIGSCNCTMALAEHEQGPLMTVSNTDATMYTSSIVNVAATFNSKFLQIAGPPETSQRNPFDVLMAGSSSKPGKSLPSAKTSRY